MMSSRLHETKADNEQQGAAKSALMRHTSPMLIDARIFVGTEAVLWFQAHLSKACQLVTSTSGAYTPGSRMVRTRKRLPSGAMS